MSVSGPTISQLGKYRLIAELGHGGMADVFLAVAAGPAGFNKLVVIKQIRPQLAESPEFLEMFLDEARLAARLSHANVVHTNEVCEEAGRYFIAMEYLEGQPLNRLLHRLKSQGGLPLHYHVRVLVDVLAGLHHAHELRDYDGTPLGVVHRDVSPHNVFVTYEGQVKVVDFGIAKALNSSSVTRSGVLKGKIAYMAPEQARGDRVDRRADLFSVGVMLWEAAIGRRLWKGIPELNIQKRLLDGDLPTPRSVDPEVPEELDAIIQKAMALEPEARFETAAEFQVALEKYLDDQGTRVYPRDIARVVQDAFRQDRQDIKATIEESLNANSGTRMTMLQHTETGASSESNGDPVVRPSTAPSYTGSTAQFTHTSAAGPDGKQRSKFGVLAAGGLVLLIGLVVYSQVPKSSAPTVQTNAANPPAQAPEPSSLPKQDAPPAQVEVSISASPSAASLFLDGKPLKGNPYTGKLPKDDASHTLRVEAEGYVAKTEELSLDRDLNVAVALLKAPEPEPSVKKPAARPPTVRKPPPPANTKPSVIDTSNPY